MSDIRLLDKLATLEEMKERGIPRSELTSIPGYASAFDSVYYLVASLWDCDAGISGWGWVNPEFYEHLGWDYYNGMPLYEFDLDDPEQVQRAYDTKESYEKAISELGLKFNKELPGHEMSPEELTYYLALTEYVNRWMYGIRNNRLLKNN